MFLPRSTYEPFERKLLPLPPTSCVSRDEVTVVRVRVIAVTPTRTGTQLRASWYYSEVTCPVTELPVTIVSCLVTVPAGLLSLCVATSDEVFATRNYP